MPLVDYASSDEESCDDSEVTPKKGEGENEKKEVVASAEIKDSINSDGGELFSSLPKPRKTFSVLEDDNKLSKLLLNKSSVIPGKKENVKITVPSISEFDSDTQEPLPKKLKPSSKGAGLFSILPPPKNTTVVTSTNLVPHPLSQKQLKQSAKKAVTNKLMKSAKPDEDDDDDVTVGSSFFGSSLVEQPSNSEFDKINNDSISYNETPDNCPVMGTSFGGGDFKVAEQNPNRSLVINTNEEKSVYSTNPSQEPETVSADENPLDLDEKALQILCGNKKKRQQMPMNIIDLSSEEVLPDSKEWLLKQFTEERRGRGHSHKKSHGPSSQSRRKHQITYLAYQAKEQELELQNQWAQNRMTRKQTQSKYGF